MKKFLVCYFPLLALCMLHAGEAFSQSLHAIVFADTNDPSIGSGDKQDFVNMTMEMSTIASATGLHLEKYFYSGSNCSKSNLMGVLDRLQTSSGDVVMFYYSGHGTRSVQDESDYPQMCLGSHYDNEFVPLEYVLRRLEDMPARLKIVFGDCCNSVAPGVTSKEQASKGFTVLSKSPVNAYTNLFMNYKGTIIASGSQKGENSVTLNYNDGSPAGGAFTIFFLRSLQFVVSNGMDADWDIVLSNAREDTKNAVKHTPVYSVDVETTVDRHEGHAPENAATPDDTDGLQAPIDLLTAIGNDKYDIDLRIEVMERTLPVVFASPDVKVESVGRNGTTVVSTERAKDFMLRLCTLRNLVNLVEVDFKRDSNGKYTYLKVHEIYKDYE